MSLLRGLCFSCVSLVLTAAGCGSDDAEPAPGGQTETIDPFNGDCSSARWSHLSDACWSCLCGACADTLNACNEGCTTVMECAFEKGTFVNNAADIPCEIRATATECLPGAPEGAAQAVIAFDTCLIAAQKPSGFRVCEDVCQIEYPGDVCERYPAM
jgi:hypothetical protein